jgi:hypothetical protein
MPRLKYLQRTSVTRELLIIQVQINMRLQSASMRAAPKPASVRTPEQCNSTDDEDDHQRIEVG